MSKETIGQRLRRLRIEQGLSQRDLAVERLDAHHTRGITSAYISRIESDARYPSLQVIRHLAQRLNVTPEYLETGDGPVLAFAFTSAEIDEAARNWGGAGLPNFDALRQDGRIGEVTLHVHELILDTLAARIYALAVIDREAAERDQEEAMAR